MDIKFAPLKNKPFSNAQEQSSEDRTFQGLRYLDSYSDYNFWSVTGPLQLTYVLWISIA